MIGFEGAVGLAALFGDEMSGQQMIVQAPIIALRMDASKCIAAAEVVLVVEDDPDVRDYTVEMVRYEVLLEVGFRPAVPPGTGKLGDDRIGA
jgi:hypothetical protein